MRALNHELKRVSSKQSHLLEGVAHCVPQGIVERVTFVFKDANTGVALERYIFEVGFPMGLSAFKEDGQKDRGWVCGARLRVSDPSSILCSHSGFTTAHSNAISS